MTAGQDLDLYYTDPAHLITAGVDLDDLDRDLSVGCAVNNPVP